MTQQIHKLEDSLASCNRCGLCHGCSPLLEVQKLESSTARGKIRLARSFIRGELEASDTLVDRIYECLMCGHCSSTCPAGIRVEEIIQETRTILVSARKTPHTLRSIASKINLSGNVYGKEIEGYDLPDNELVYFPGCVSSIKHPELANVTISCLNSAGVEVTVLKGICCGAPAWAAGFTEVYDKISEKLQAMLEDKNVVTSCPQCYYFLKKIRHIQVQHVTQTYTEMLNKQKLRPLKPIKGTYTYFDPCYLARFSNIVDEPRAVMSHLRKFKLIEMESNRKNAKCCGNGLGLGQTSYPELSSKVARNRVGEALDITAETVVTSCPHCYLTLGKVGRERKTPVEIRDISQLLEEACMLSSSTRKQTTRISVVG
jgi:Fe-S oxidoreductase